MNVFKRSNQPNNMPHGAADGVTEGAPVVKSWSLRTRLMLLLMLATTGLWGIASWSMFQEAQRNSRELFDESLRETAYLLLTVVEHEMSEEGAEYAGDLIDEAYPSTRDLRFQIWDRDGRLIYRSAGTQAEPLADESVGYAWIAFEGESLRTYAVWNQAHSLQIQIAEPLSYRERVVERSLSRLAWFAAVLLPSSAFMVWWIVKRSFVPIAWISHSVAARRAENLHDVDSAAAPREVQPLLDALNRLLGRVRQQVEYERRFTADAAHELRTPLAAIRAHAQVLLAARNTTEAGEAANDIIEGVDRSRRLVDQLLLLARLEQRPLSGYVTVSLTSLIAGQVAAHRALAEKLNIELIADTAAASVIGNADALDMMLRNLIDNALRYTPAGGTVRVSCRSDERGAVLEVSDSGMGIPPEERARVFERFYRIAGSPQYGSGLGLSIVQRVAEQHGAQLEVGPGLNGAGTCFGVLFPASSQFAVTAL